jgi:DNA-binding NtrC family response regulator
LSLKRVLLVDDERDFRSMVAERLKQEAYTVEECETATEAISRMRTETFDVILTDLRMPGKETGVDLLKEATMRLPDAILIVMTAYASLESAIESLRLGAHDYLLKPLRLDELALKISRFRQHRETLAENRFLRKQTELLADPGGLIGASSSTERLRQLISKVAATDSTVLLLGETGTGKEVVARAIHKESARREGPFVVVNCSAIPESLLESELFGHVRGAFTGADRQKTGLFEVAESGTIFLDEIGEMPLSLQPKILRVLENHEFLRLGSTETQRSSARVIAATHRDLKSMVGNQGFREDLYYRLAAFEIPLEPLSRRIEDIAPIAAHLIERIARTMNRPVPTLDPEVLDTLEHYHWPGNIRELSNVLERAMILSEDSVLRLADLPGFLGSSTPAPRSGLKAARVSFERTYIARIVAQSGGDKVLAAKALGISLASLYRKLGTSESSKPSTQP